LSLCSGTLVVHVACAHTYICSNAVLEANGVAKPRYLKTGTTITGVVFKVHLLMDLF
jgi:hypothetical protein